MINYQPFWETLKASGESTYSLIHDYSISSATIDRLRKNRPLSTSTINDLCIILGCSPENTMLHHFKLKNTSESIEDKIRRLWFLL